MTGEDFGLRERLDVALERLAPSAPPVAAVVRKGQIMRTAQRAGIGAGLAVIAVAAAVTVPRLAAPSQPPTAPHAMPRQGGPGGPHPVLSVTELGSRAVGGVIAQGSAKGTHQNQTWRIWVDQRAGKVYGAVVGARRWTLGSLTAAEHVTGIEAFDNAGIEAWSGSYGVVRPDVTKITVTLNNYYGNHTFDLRPVSAAGFRWVGLIFPIGDFIVRETAYAGDTVVGRMVTFHGEIVSWLRPGEAGPARAVVPLGYGVLPGGWRWRLVENAGPWGYCLTLQGRSGTLPDIAEDCLSPDAARTPGLRWIEPRDSGRNVRWLIGTATPATAYVRVVLANGRTLQAPVTDVSGQVFFAVCVLRGVPVQSWAAYDAAGRKLFGGLG